VNRFDQLAASRPGPFLPMPLPRYEDALILYWFAAAVQHDKCQGPDARDQYLGWIRTYTERAR
jgi:hypothetical protein